MGLVTHPFSFLPVEANHIPVQCSRAIIAYEAKRDRLQFRLAFWISTRRPFSPDYQIYWFGVQTP